MLRELNDYDHTHMLLSGDPSVVELKAVVIAQTIDDPIEVLALGDNNRGKRLFVVGINDNVILGGLQALDESRSRHKIVKLLVQLTKDDPDIHGMVVASQSTGKFVASNKFNRELAATRDRMMHLEMVQDQFGWIAV
jgi:hypothetical protein